MATKTRAKTATVQRFMMERNHPEFNVNDYKPQLLLSTSEYRAEIEELSLIVRNPHATLLGRTGALKLLNFIFTTQRVPADVRMSSVYAVIAERLLTSRSVVERYQTYEFLWHAEARRSDDNDDFREARSIIPAICDAVVFDAARINLIDRDEDPKKLGERQGILVIAKNAFAHLSVMLTEAYPAYVTEFLFDTILAGISHCMVFSKAFEAFVHPLVQTVEYPALPTQVLVVHQGSFRVICKEDSRSTWIENKKRIRSSLGSSLVFEVETSRHYDVLCSYLATGEFPRLASMQEAVDLVVAEWSGALPSFRNDVQVYAVMTTVPPEDSDKIGLFIRDLKDRTCMHFKLHLMFVLLIRRNQPPTAGWAAHDVNLFAHLLNVFLREPQAQDTKPTLQLSSLAETPALEALLGHGPMSKVHPRVAGDMCAKRCLSVPYTELSFWYRIIYDAVHAWPLKNRTLFARRFLFTAMHEFFCEARTVHRRKEMAGILLMLSSFLDEGLEDEGDFAVFAPSCAVGYSALALREGPLRADGDGAATTGVLRWLCRYD